MLSLSSLATNSQKINKKRIAYSVFLVTLFLSGKSQSSNDSFFAPKTQLKISFSINREGVRQTKKDSNYLNTRVFYLSTLNEPDSITVGIKERGNFRSKHCNFPPLWFKIKPSKAKGTVFQGNMKLKLVLPCYDRNGSNELILREFICYKLYEEVTPFSFNTRLADVDLTMVNKKKSGRYQLKGIFIEDINQAAERLHARPLKTVNVPPHGLHDTTAVRSEFFQYMIANTDWSTAHQHNAKLVVQGHNKFISVMYDFDMAGLVDAPYAMVSEVNGKKLDITRVSQRIYRGFCRDPEIMELVRQEFLSKKEKYLSIPDQLAGELTVKDIEGIKSYLNGFFDILKDDRLFNNNILHKCRTE